MMMSGFLDFDLTSSRMYMVETKTKAFIFFGINNTMIEVSPKANWEGKTGFPSVFKSCGGMLALYLVTEPDMVS
jgi:hypothetical protein